MSSTRRTANEINILAMLDRHERGGLPRRVLRRLRGTALLRIGAAGVLVCGMVGVLVWLAQDSGAPGNADAALAGAGGEISAPANRQAGAAIAPLAPEAPEAPEAPAAAADTLHVKVPDAPAQGGAAIVDVAPPDAAASAVAAATPAVQASAAPAPAPSPPQQHAGRSAPRRPATAKPAPPSRTQALAHAVPRARRPAQPQKAAPAKVDTDVALISAIIQHANKRQESDEAANKP